MFKALLRKVTGRYGAQLTANMIQLLFGGGYSIVLASLLGVDSFGQYAFMMAISTVCIQVFEIRGQDIVAQISRLADPQTATPEDRLEVSRLLGVEGASRLAGMGLTVLVCGVLSMVGLLPGAALWFAILFGLSNFLSKVFIGTSAGVVRAFERFEFLSVIYLLDFGTKMGLALLAYWIAGHLSLGMAAVTQAIGAVPVLLVQLYLLRRYLSRQSLRVEFSALREHSRALARSNLLLSWSEMIPRELDTFLAGLVFSDAQVAVYKLAKMISAIVWRAADPMFYLFMHDFPKFVARHDAAGIQAIQRKAAMALGPLSVLGIAALYGIMQWDVIASRVASYEGLGLALVIVSCWMVPVSMVIWLHPLANAVGRPQLVYRGAIAASGVFALCFALAIVMPSGGFWLFCGCIAIYHMVAHLFIYRGLRGWAQMLPAPQ